MQSYKQAQGSQWTLCSVSGTTVHWAHLWWLVQHNPPTKTEDLLLILGGHLHGGGDVVWVLWLFFFFLLKCTTSSLNLLKIKFFSKDGHVVLLLSVISPFPHPLGCDIAQFSRNREFQKPSTRALAWRQEHEQTEDFNHILLGPQLGLKTHMNYVCECDQKNTGNTAASIWIWKGIHFPVSCLGQKEVVLRALIRFSC